MRCQCHAEHEGGSRCHGVVVCEPRVAAYGHMLYPLLASKDTPVIGCETFTGVPARQAALCPEVLVVAEKATLKGRKHMVPLPLCRCFSFARGCCCTSLLLVMFAPAVWLTGDCWGVGWCGCGYGGHHLVDTTAKLEAPISRGILGAAPKVPPSGASKQANGFLWSPLYALVPPGLLMLQWVQNWQATLHQSLAAARSASERMHEVCSESLHSSSSRSAGMWCLVLRQSDRGPPLIKNSGHWSSTAMLPHECGSVCTTVVLMKQPLV